MTNFAVCEPALRRHRDRKQRQVAAVELRQLDQHPQTLHRHHDRREHGALHTHREIHARRLVPRRIHVIDQVDAADEGDAPVDMADLPVQPPQPVQAELPWRHLRPVFHEAHAA